MSAARAPLDSRAIAPEVRQHLAPSLRELAADPAVQSQLARIHAEGETPSEKIFRRANPSRVENAPEGQLARLMLLERQVVELTREVELYRPVIIRLGVLLAGREEAL